MVSYSWFAFLGTRCEHTWGSRATKNSWNRFICITVNVEALDGVDHGYHDIFSGLVCFESLVMFEELFNVLDVRILVTEDLIKPFDTAFFVVRKIV